MKEKQIILHMKRAISFYSQGLMAFLFQNNKKALYYVQKGKWQNVDVFLGSIIEFFIQNYYKICNQFHQPEKLAEEDSCICSICEYNVQNNYIDAEYFISFLIEKYPRIKVIREIVLMHYLKKQQYDRVLFLLKKEYFMRVLDNKKRIVFTAFIFLEKSKSLLHAQEIKRAIRYAWKSFKLNPCRHNIQMLFDFFIQQKI